MAEFFATGRVTNTCGGKCIAPHEAAAGPEGARREKWPTLAAIVAAARADSAAATARV